MFSPPPPWAHQQRVYEKTRSLPYFGLFAEPRTGKTRIILMKAAYRCPDLKTLVIFAPNGVHRNWVTDEIPKWLDPAVNYECHVWRSPKARLKKTAAALHRLCAHKGLAVLAVNIDAITNPIFQGWLKLFLKRGKAYGVVDESGDIARDSAQRTRAMLRWRDAFAWREVLDGTPMAESPLDIYTQAEFLAHGALGYTSYVAFKYRYAVIQKMPIPGVRGQQKEHAACNGLGCPGCGFIGLEQGRTFDQVVGYKNQDELKARLARFSVVIKRKDCADLPDKIMGKRFYPLSAEQRRVYDELREQYAAELQDGREVTAALVLTRYLRLQQVCHNFWPETKTSIVHAACSGEGCAGCDGLGVTVSKIPLTIIDPAHSPRIDILMAELERQPGQAIIWTTYHQDGDLLMDRLKDAVRYDGTISEVGRAESKRLFQTGAVRWLVGNPAAGGRGLDFSNAQAMFFYGHTWRMRVRGQAEDRGESLVRRVGMAVTDIVAEDTVDEDFIAAHKKKLGLSAFLMQDSGWRKL